MKTRGSLIVLSGFAGVGKGTVLKSLFETHEGYAYSVSATTRDPRPGEVDGVHYFFITKERFEQMIGNDELLEHAEKQVTLLTSGEDGTPVETGFAGDE